MVAWRFRAFRPAWSYHARTRRRRRRTTRLPSFTHRWLDQLLSRFDERKCSGKRKTLRHPVGGLGVGLQEIRKNGALWAPKDLAQGMNTKSLATAPTTTCEACALSERLCRLSLN